MIFPLLREAESARLGALLELSIAVTELGNLFAAIDRRDWREAKHASFSLRMQVLRAELGIERSWRYLEQVGLPITGPMLTTVGTPEQPAVVEAYDVGCHACDAPFTVTSEAWDEVVSCPKCGAGNFINAHVTPSDNEEVGAGSWVHAEKPSPSIRTASPLVPEVAP